MSAAVIAGGLAGACALLAAWEASTAASEERAVRAAARWLAPLLDLVRSGREPSSPERRRLAVLGSLALLGGGWLVGGPWVALAAGTAAPWLAGALLRDRRRRREAAIADGVPAIARALADALAGGHSVRGALAAAAGDGGVDGPAGQELRRAAAALDVGARTQDVLRALAGDPDRTRAQGPMDTLVAAVLLQRDAGGDLAALLRELGAALEERSRVLADARSATAQARFTALLVSGLPAVALATAELARPGFVAGLVSSPLTGAIVGLALALQAIAFLCVRRIARTSDSW